MARDDLEDREHERALARAFELRHPMLALALRMIKRRPFTGTIMALLFFAASTIAIEGFSAINKRFSTWLDVNYVSSWQAHDRAQALLKSADEEEQKRGALKVREGIAAIVPAGHGIVVHYEKEFDANRPWQEIPTDGVEYVQSLSSYIRDSAGHHFTLPPGDLIAPFRNGAGDIAQFEIRDKAFVLVHAMFWSAVAPWRADFPADFKDRDKVCGGDGAADCAVYGYISRADYDALGLPARDGRVPSVVGYDVLPPPPKYLGPPFGQPVPPYPPADLSNIHPVVTPVDEGASFVRLPPEWVAALVKIASLGFYKSPFASQLIVDRFESTWTPRIEVGTPYTPFLAPYPGHPELPRIPVLVSCDLRNCARHWTGILVTIDDGDAKGQQGLLKFDYEFERLYKPAIVAWHSREVSTQQDAATGP
ncbi:MAG TPA: hypothetical protein VGG48_00915 [Rhizomicrobium sp.]|jgi:hypothetical protein